MLHGVLCSTMVSKTTLSRDCEFPAVLHVSNGECPWNVDTFNMMDNELEPHLGQVQGFPPSLLVVPSEDVLQFIKSKGIKGKKKAFLP